MRALLALGIGPWKKRGASDVVRALCGGSAGRRPSSPGGGEILGQLISKNVVEPGLGPFAAFSSMNRSAGLRPGSLEATICPLAGSETGAPIAWFMGREQVQMGQGLP